MGTMVTLAYHWVVGVFFSFSFLFFFRSTYQLSRVSFFRSSCAAMSTQGPSGSWDMISKISKRFHVWRRGAAGTRAVPPREAMPKKHFSVWCRLPWSRCPLAGSIENTYGSMNIRDGLHDRRSLDRESAMVQVHSMVARYGEI